MLKAYKFIRKLAYACALVGIALSVLYRTGLVEDVRAMQVGYTLLLITFCLFFLSYGLIFTIRMKK